MAKYFEVLKLSEIEKACSSKIKKKAMKEDDEDSDDKDPESPEPENNFEKAGKKKKNKEVKKEKAVDDIALILDFEKATVKQHTRKTKSGKLSTVKQYEDKRSKKVEPKKDIMKEDFDKRTTISKLSNSLKEEYSKHKEDIGFEWEGNKAWIYIRGKKEDVSIKRNIKTGKITMSYYESDKLKKEKEIKNMKEAKGFIDNNFLNK